MPATTTGAPFSLNVPSLSSDLADLFGTYLVPNMTAINTNAAHKGTAQTFSALQTFSAGLNVSSGNVGIGTSSPSASHGLTVQNSILSRNTSAAIEAQSSGGHSYVTTDSAAGYYAYVVWRYNGSNKWSMLSDTSATLYLVDADNNNGVYMTQNTTSWTANSDSRLKDVQGTITDALAKVGQLTGVKFTWKRDQGNPDAKVRVGLIAQDVQAVLPEAVDDESPDLITDEETGKVSGGLGVRYTEVVPLLVNAIKELTARVVTLEAQVASA